MGLPPPAGYKPPTHPPKKESPQSHVPQRYHHRYSKIGSALEHTSEVMRFRSGATSKAGPSIGRSATSQKTSSSKSGDQDEEIKIECPADTFGRECSERGKCDNILGQCTCNKGTSSSSSLNPFGFLELEADQTMTLLPSSSSLSTSISGGSSKGGEPFGPGCEFTTCPTVDGKECNGQGTCNKRLGECQCFPGWMGDDCATDPNSLNVFQEDCEDMNDHYIAECIRATTTGACKAYQLTWDRLCFKTCVAVLGKTCDLQQRRDFCSHSPDCEVLCNSMFDISCNRYVSEDPTAIFDKVDNAAPNATDTNEEAVAAPAPASIPVPLGSPSPKPYRVKKAGNAKYDRKGGRGNKAGHQRKKSGIANKSGLHIKTERDDGTKKRLKGGMRGGHPLVGNPPAVPDVDTTLEDAKELEENLETENTDSTDATDQATEKRRTNKSRKGGKQSPSSESPKQEELQNAYDKAFPKFKAIEVQAAFLEVHAMDLSRRRKSSGWKPQNTRSTRSRNPSNTATSKMSFLETGSAPNMKLAIEHLRKREHAVREQLSVELGFNMMNRPQKKLHVKGSNGNGVSDAFSDAFQKLESNQQFYSRRAGGQGNAANVYNTKL